MIQFHQVIKKYPDNDFVLGEVNFVVEEGEFIFLIGPSGSGKTSLIRMLIREEVPTAGKIFFDDYDITKLSRNNVYKLRRQIGVIFQDYKLIPDKNTYENVAFAMEAAGRTTAEIEETVPYVLDIVGLADRAEAFPEQLSGGEKQRVAIARAVANNPRVLVADEPTGNLDPASAWDIVQILSKINNWGTTVIMCTHGSDIVNSLNKRVVQLNSGQIVRDDSTGRYEATNLEPEVAQALAEHLEEQEKSQRKGPFTVKIKQKEEKSDSKKRLGLFGLSWLGFARPKKKDDIIDKEGNVQDVDYEGVSMEEVVNGDPEKIVEKADNTKLGDLDLSEQVVNDLQAAGYEDVEDVISAGPDKLEEELTIDPEEVVEVAKALEKFVEETSDGTEKEKKKEKNKKEESPKEKEQKAEAKPKKKKNSKRVKLNLVADK